MRPRTVSLLALSAMPLALAACSGGDLDLAGSLGDDAPAYGIAPSDVGGAAVFQTVDGTLTSAFGEPLAGWVVAAFDHDSGLAVVGEANANGQYALEGVQAGAALTLAVLTPDHRLASVLAMPGETPKTVQSFFRAWGQTLPRLEHRGGAAVFVGDGYVLTPDVASDADGNGIPDGMEWVNPGVSGVATGGSATGPTANDPSASDQHDDDAAGAHDAPASGDPRGLQQSDTQSEDTVPGVAAPAPTGPDLDLDGIPNDRDLDIDGDGVINPLDPDMDGDGLLDAADPDVDGDGELDATDPNLPRPSLAFDGIDAGIGLERWSDRLELRITARTRYSGALAEASAFGAPALLSGATIEVLDDAGQPTQVAWNRTLGDDGLAGDEVARDGNHARRVRLAAGAVARGIAFVSVRAADEVSTRGLRTVAVPLFDGAVDAVTAQYDPGTRSVLLAGNPFGALQDFQWAASLYDAAGALVWTSVTRPGLTRQVVLDGDWAPRAESFSVTAWLPGRPGGPAPAIVHGPRLSLR